MNRFLIFDLAEKEEQRSVELVNENHFIINNVILVLISH